MKVAIDSGPLAGGHSVRGIGFYTKNLTKAMSGEVSVVDFSASSDEELSKYDILHYPYFDLFFNTLRLVDGVKTVVTIHDVIPLIYPEHYPPGIRGKVNFWRQKYLLKKVDRVITDSETSKKDIVRLLDYPADKIDVVYLAAANHMKFVSNNKKLNQIKRKFNLDDKFVFYVGDVNFNKNVARLVRACINVKIQLVIAGKHALQVDEILKQSGGGLRDKLRKITGKKHPEISHLEELLDLFENQYVKRVGFISDEELVALYNLTSLYVFPSLYEGFGLSPLEAMACGAPVIINKSQTLVEVSGGGAMVVDVNKSGELEKAIKKVTSNKKFRDKLVKKAGKHVKEFSWKKSAKETLNIYKKLHE